MKILITLLLTALLISCNNKEIKPDLKINQNIYNAKKPQAKYNNLVFVRVNNIKDKILNKKVNINQQNISLIDAINIVMPNINIIAKDSDVVLTKKVSVRADNLNFGEYLKQLASVSKYYITTNGKKVFIASKLTKTWDVSTLVDNQSVITTNNEGLSSASNTSDLDEIVKQLKTILGNNAFINHNNKFGTLSISSTVDKINLADNYISQLITSSKKQIFFDIKIIETNIDDSASAGVDFSIFSNGTSDIDAGSGAISISSMLKKPIVFNELKIDLLLNLLDKYGKTQIVNNPTILLQNGSRKAIKTTQNSTYIKSIETTVQDGGAVIVTPQTAEISTGLELSIAGVIANNNKLISIDIHPKVSSIKSWERLTTGSGDYSQELNLPSFNETDLNVKAMIKPGQTMLIGGLYAESYAADINSSNNEILDSVFGSTKTKKDKKEILILVTPTLMTYE